MGTAKKRPLRILYLLNASGGGATQGILELLRSLPREDYQAFLAVPDQPDAHQRATFSQLAQAWFHVPMVWWNLKVDLPWYWRVFVWGRGWLKTLGHLRSVWRLCEIIRQQEIDIVYTNTVMILDGALAARLCGVPHLWHIKEWIGSQARVKFILPDRLLVKMIASLSACVIVMSHFIGNIFLEHGATENLRVIYDGVNLSDFHGFQSNPAGAALREKLNIPANRFLVGMSASPSSIWKRHDIFISMAALLAACDADMSFVVFGAEPLRHGNPAYNQPWAYYQALRARVKQMGLEKQFYWAGYCNDIPAMMDALDVLVHPCETEPFGRVAIEAMAASCPVVGPCQGGIAESVIHQTTGLLVAPGNPQAFANAVKALYDNPMRRAEFAAAGPNQVARWFSIQQHLEEICQVYQSLPKKTKVRKA